VKCDSTKLDCRCCQKLGYFSLVEQAIREIFDLVIKRVNDDRRRQSICTAQPVYSASIPVRASWTYLCAVVKHEIQSLARSTSRDGSGFKVTREKSWPTPRICRPLFIENCNMRLLSVVDISFPNVSTGIGQMHNSKYACIADRSGLNIADRTSSRRRGARMPSRFEPLVYLRQPMVTIVQYSSADEL
jgi:hypothetical protein